MESLRNRPTGLAIILVLMGTLAAGVPVSASEESAEVTQLEAELAAVTAERDALLAQAETMAVRHERSGATQEQIMEIIADPTAFGTESEVLDLLDELAAPTTVYGDDAFGNTSWRTGWRNTLFGQVDATIHTWLRWLSDDGSVGGSMWTWSGTALNGEPFDLQGIELSTYDEHGLLDGVTVYYPYEDAEVRLRFNQGNEAALLARESD